MDVYSEQTNYGKCRVVRREPCPKCRAGGGDKSGDNRIVYDDEHTHCFGCGTHEHAPIMSQIERLVKATELDWKPTSDLDFPEDFMPLHSALWCKESFAWLKKYGILNDEITFHRIGWSNKRNLLIFPVFSDSGHLLMWQGRYFGGDPKHPKYVTKGPKSDIMHVVGPKWSSIVLVVEDMVSAIKVGRQYNAMPLWGASMTLGTLRKLAERFKEVGMWLDANKAKTSVEIALRGSQYVSTFVCSTENDPKALSDDMIRATIADGRQLQMLTKNKPEPLIQTVDGERREIDSQTGEVLSITEDPTTFRWPFADKALPKVELQDLNGASEGTREPPIIFGWESRLHAHSDPIFDGAGGGTDTHAYSYRKDNGRS